MKMIDIIFFIPVLAIIFFTVRRIVKNKKSGKSMCSMCGKNGCSSCQVSHMNFQNIKPKNL